MKGCGLICALLILLSVLPGGVTGRTVATEDEARQGFEQILDLWRGEDYEGLFARLDHPAGQGWGYFAERIVYASRIPACCWEKIQEVGVVVLDENRVVLTAKVGLEVAGVGTRFVTKEFRLRRVAGVWKLPMHEILDLSAYNRQRVPRKVYERQP
jgi:hypothetical protein